MVSSKRCFTSYDNIGDRSWGQFRRLNVQNPAGLHHDFCLIMFCIMNSQFRLDMQRHRAQQFRSAQSQIMLWSLALAK